MFGDSVFSNGGILREPGVLECAGLTALLFFLRGAEPPEPKRRHAAALQKTEHGTTENSPPEQPLRRDLLEHFPCVFVVGAGAQVVAQVAGSGGAVTLAQGECRLHLEQTRVIRL